MGLTGRGDSTIAAERLEVRDSHIGIWLEETARLTLRHSTLKCNESAGLCAYVNSSAQVYDSVFEGNQDDGVYAENDAAIHVVGSTIRGNKPYGLRAIDNGRIVVESSRVVDNENNFSQGVEQR